MARLTIAICTYNRNELLRHCLQSIATQLCHELEVLVINNFPDQENHQQLIELCEIIPGCRVLKEYKTGLSYARNRALRESKTEYIAYIDDDAKLTDNYVCRAIELIHKENLMVVGGHIKSWWFYGRPVWLRSDWGEKPTLGDKLTKLAEDQYLWGSNMIFARTVLEHIGGFPEDQGMKGHVIAYGAENIAQINLRARGHNIYYDPSLVVEHMVIKEKLALGWHLRSIRSSSKAGRIVFPEQFTFNKRIMKYIRLPMTVLKSTWQLLTDRRYFRQNWVLDNWRALN